MTYTADGGWMDWFRLGGTWSTYAPAAVTWGRGRIDTFVVGSTDTKLYHTYLDPSSSTWQPQGTFESLAGFLAGRPVAVSWGLGRIDVFVRGGDAGLWHLVYADSGWGNWTKVAGGGVRAEPEAVSPTSDRIDVFLWRDSDGGYERRTYQDRSWGSPEMLGGGPFRGPPKAAVDGSVVRVYGYDGAGDVLYRGFDWEKGSWENETWESLGKPGD